MHMLICKLSKSELFNISEGKVAKANKLCENERIAKK